MEGVALGHDSTVWDLAFDTSGERLASVSDDGTLKVWDAHLQDSGEPHFKLLATLQGDHTRSVYALSWSSQGAIATACGASPQLYDGAYVQPQCCGGQKPAMRMRRQHNCALFTARLTRGIAHVPAHAASGLHTTPAASIAPKADCRTAYCCVTLSHLSTSATNRVRGAQGTMAFVSLTARREHGSCKPRWQRRIHKM